MLLRRKKSDLVRRIQKLGYSPEETAIMTGLSLSTVHRGIRDGTIPSTKYKERRIITGSTIEGIIKPTNGSGTDGR
jgi:DNA invertase Pin-like site-specific DNA recombinase